ncbi:MAG: hypothetical protein CM15mV18_0320 [uncultured marine virus]|nr:MAG: hypothetical protein CM15mV18_0320 [uncultured marine virus]
MEEEFEELMPQDNYERRRNNRNGNQRRGDH